ncbi:MAG: DUF4383 domain-containing protein [Chloroflexota bacterium]
MSNMTMIQKITVALGAFYVLIGILGFVPGITVATAVPGQGLLLGIFAVNLIHNIAHLLLGAILIVGGMMAANTVMVNKLMAVIFAVLVVASFIAPIVEGVAINPPDTVLHLVSAALTAYLGFMAKSAMGMRPA